jgi:hypothetical protein
MDGAGFGSTCRTSDSIQRSRSKSLGAQSTCLTATPFFCSMIRNACLYSPSSTSLGLVFCRPIWAFVMVIDPEARPPRYYQSRPLTEDLQYQSIPGLDRPGQSTSSSSLPTSCSVSSSIPLFSGQGLWLEQRRQIGNRTDTTCRSTVPPESTSGTPQEQSCADRSCWAQSPSRLYHLAKERLLISTPLSSFARCF